MPVVLISILVVVVSPCGALKSCDAETLWAVPVVDVCTWPLASLARRVYLIKKLFFSLN